MPFFRSQGRIRGQVRRRDDDCVNRGPGWRDMPNQVLVVVAFTVIAFWLAVGPISSASRAVRRADETIAYAMTEIEGARQISRALELSRELLAYRAKLVDARKADGPLGAAMRARLAALERRWRPGSATAVNPPASVAAAIDSLEPLLGAIAGKSGISNDPSIDGINFGDAILRFPVALVDATEAGSIARLNLAAGDAGLGQRFHAAELLAQGETAIRVGSQDAEDERDVDAAAAAPFIREAGKNVGDFEALRREVTDAYVQPAPAAPSHYYAHYDAHLDGALAGRLDANTRSSFAVLDTLSQDLVRVLTARIDDATGRRSSRVGDAAAEITLEVLTMLTLAWINVIGYRNARRNAEAEKLVLESQRQALEGQLAKAEVQQALLRTQAEFAAVFDHAPTGMVIVDRTGAVLDENEAARAMLPAAGPAGPSSRLARYASIIDQIFSGKLEEFSGEEEYDEYLDPGNGKEKSARWLGVSIAPVLDGNGSTRVVVLMIRDVTDSKRLEAKLVHEAGHDSLTGLPNRKQFLELLQAALDQRGRAGDDRLLSVAYIDFNDFKTINDSFGHHAGDNLLVEGAARLRNCIRTPDIVARIGGDEFALLLHGRDRDDIEQTVARLQAVVSSPVKIEGHYVASSASFGIAYAEDHYTQAAEIVRDADTAMYQAKSQGGHRYVVFETSMRDQVLRRMQYAIDFARALAGGQMELSYQPIVDLETARIVGSEALVRWRRPDGALIEPAEFIPLAEESSAIVEIGHWVATTACEQMRKWNELARRDLLPALTDDFAIHVNLSVPEVHHADLIASLQHTLEQAKVPRRQIVLEIPEGILMRDTAQVLDKLGALVADGFRLCLDEFGTGYASLRYLNELPLDCFKIDRSIVSVEPGSGKHGNGSIVEMLVVLSRSLELAVIAEGIETLAQWDRLAGLGCKFGQGFLFSKPLDGAAFTALLEANAPLASRLQALQPAPVRALTRVR